MVGFEEFKRQVADAPSRQIQICGSELGKSSNMRSVPAGGNPLTVNADFGLIKDFRNLFMLETRGRWIVLEIYNRVNICDTWI